MSVVQQRLALVEPVLLPEGREARRKDVDLGEARLVRVDDVVVHARAAAAGQVRDVVGLRPRMSLWKRALAPRCEVVGQSAGRNSMHRYVAPPRDLRHPQEWYGYGTSGGRCASVGLGSAPS